jgi:hypothetical protein
MKRRQNALTIALHLDRGLPKKIGMSATALYSYSRGAYPSDEAIGRLQSYFGMPLCDILAPAKIRRIGVKKRT